jgi:hypothetical protein
MKKKTLLPAITLVVLLSTTFVATAYRNSQNKACVEEIALAKEEETDGDFEDGLHGEFILESLARHLLFVKY